MNSIYHNLSDVKPYKDETLMSLVFRGFTDANCLFWRDYQRVVFGRSFNSCRLAEKRLFEWKRLEHTLNLPVDDLFGRTERSLYTSAEDGRERITTLGKSLPWLKEKGYSSYSPALLKSGDYLRVDSFKPGRIIDIENRAVILRNCHQCGAELASRRWAFGGPYCPDPSCGAALIDGPVVKASSQLMKVGAQVTSRLDQAFTRPFDEYSLEIKVLRAVYHATEEFRSNRQFQPLLVSLCDELGVGPVLECRPDDRDFTPGNAAIFYAQCWLVSDHACTEYYDTVLRWYDRMHGMPRNLVNAAKAIGRGLKQLARDRGAAANE